MCLVEGENHSMDCKGVKIPRADMIKLPSASPRYFTCKTTKSQAVRIQSVYKGKCVALYI
jgi:hypothetical protein